jgi:hypothetical protein
MVDEAYIRLTIMKYCAGSITEAAVRRSRSIGQSGLADEAARAAMALVAGVGLDLVGLRILRSG